MAEGGARPGKPSVHRTPTFPRGPRSRAEVGELRQREGPQPTCESLSAKFRSWPQPSVLIKGRRKATLRARGLGGAPGSLPSAVVDLLCAVIRVAGCGRVAGAYACASPSTEPSAQPKQPPERRRLLCAETLVPGRIGLLMEDGGLGKQNFTQVALLWLSLNPVCSGHPGVRHRNASHSRRLKERRLSSLFEN